MVSIYANIITPFGFTILNILSLYSSLVLSKPISPNDQIMSISFFSLNGK